MTPELAKVLVANTWVPFPPKFPLLGTDSNDYPKKTDELYVFFLPESGDKGNLNNQFASVEGQQPPNHE